MRESLEAKETIVSPLSHLEESTTRGGRGRVPVARLALTQVATPSLQRSQLHMLLSQVDGGESRGLSSFPLYLMPSQLPSHIQCLTAGALQLLLLARYSSAAFQQLIPLAAPRGPSAAAIAAGGAGQLQLQLHSSESVSSSSSSTGQLWVSDIDVVSLSDWARLSSRLRSFRARQDGEWLPALAGVECSAHKLLERQLPSLGAAIEALRTQPAQSLVPHLRNRLGFNIDTYVQQLRTIATELQQHQQRYARKLHAMQQR